MLKTIKLIILLFFVSHTSIAQISLIRKEHILLNINSGSTTLKTDKDILYNSVVQDIQEENNIILKVVIKSSTYDITDYFNFQVIKALPSLDPNTKYQEMNDEDLIQYVTQKYNEVKKNQKKTNSPPIQSIASFTFKNLIIKDSRDPNNIRYYKTKNYNTFGILCRK